MKNFDPSSIKGFGEGGSFSREALLQLVNRNVPASLTVLIAILTLFGGYQMLVSRMNIIWALKTELAGLSDKEVPAQGYKKALDQKMRFFSALPKPVPQEELLSFLAGKASKYGITIESFDVPVAESGIYMQKIAASFNVKAPGFRDAMLFINDLESDRYAFRIDRCEMTAERGKQAVLTGVRVELTVTTILLTDAKKD